MVQKGRKWKNLKSPSRGILVGKGPEKHVFFDPSRGILVGKVLEKGSFSILKSICGICTRGPEKNTPKTRF
jgi:hypothetical protein